MRKILDALTILSTILVLGICGGGYFTYKYLTSPQFKTKMMNEVLENGQKLIPKMLDNEIQEITGPSIMLLDDKK